MRFGVNSRIASPHRLLPRLTLATLALATAACGGFRGQPADGDPVFAVRDGGECRLETEPGVLPRAQELVDTAGLTAALRDLRSSFDFPDGHVVLTLFYQPDGLNIRRDLVEHSLPPTLADSVQKLVFAHRASMPESEREWGVRLVIDLEETISYRVAHREYCPPQPLNRQLASQMRSFFSTGPRYRGGVRERDVVVRLGVLPSGIVGGARVIRGADAGSELEQRLMLFVRQYAFQPATLDGFPVYGEIDIPVRVRDR